jgi:sulfoxide reductase heme-binding subunit YedZ
VTGVLAAAGPSPLWYLSRGAGAVALVLLTVSVVLGILNVQRWRTERWPRFVVDGLHRNVSLLVLLILAIHILTTVLDKFTAIDLKDAVIPFVSSYRPIWLGLGALAFDMLLAVALTSVLRQHMSLAAWRRIHWLAYAVWPVALVHGLGTGTDAKSMWMLVLSIACVAVVGIAAWIRVMGSSPDRTGRRLSGYAALMLGPVALAVWLPNGPLGPAWARRAGTPALPQRPHLRSVGAKPAPRPSQSTLAVPFTAQLSGTRRDGQTSDGLASVDLQMTFEGKSPGAIDIRIVGQPVQGGGVQMTQSAVTLGPSSNPGAYSGRVVALQGQRVLATATDSAGRSLRLDLALAIDTTTPSVGGTISVRAEGGGG